MPDWMWALAMFGVMFVGLGALVADIVDQWRR